MYREKNKNTNTKIIINLNKDIIKMQTMFNLGIMNKVIPLGLLGLLLLSKPATATGTNSFNRKPLNTFLKESQLIALEPLQDNQEGIPISVSPPPSNNNKSLVENPVLIPASVDPMNYSPASEASPALTEKTEETSNFNDSQPIPIVVTPPLIDSEQNTLVSSSESASKQKKIVPSFNQRLHKVGIGETLNSIAREYGITREELIQANNLTNPDLLKVNQSLTIPSPNAKIPNKPTLIPVKAQENLTANNDFGEVYEDNQTQANQRIVETNLESNDYQSSPSNNEVSSAIPIEIEYYDPAIQPTPGEMVSPDLPQLYPPDQYLPNSNGGTFNGYIWPAKGVLTSGYGWRWGRMHKGIDIAAPIGTPVVAAADGQVLSAGWNSGGYGNLVKLRHFDGSITLYAHNSKIFVRRGQTVSQGQQIAAMGNTGYSTGPHLHFEVRPQSDKAVNPIAFLPRK